MAFLRRAFDVVGGLNNGDIQILQKHSTKKKQINLNSHFINYFKKKKIKFGRKKKKKKKK